jgi:hypothetical protein
MKSDVIEETFTKLRLLKVADLRKTRTLSQEQQGYVQLICDRYLAGLPDDRARIRSMVTPNISFLFFMYAGCMAVEAVRERQEQKISKGLVAIAIENQVFDWRDSMVVLVRLYHSAARIGSDPVELFRRVAAISTAQTSKELLQFSARTPESLDLAKFGFKEAIDSDGNFAYVPK